ncbi:hypothetical protein SLEP1_g26235 [Rubroshorea leprosula]|uniref:Uncharacterized protein n=1 Tax=Rubroshorea leprosula TaxID=152421 RepID=A0AAV5JL24_9ROSI|nr:hypothetical protein SLEP1_g26235 [Rubroshorea leprosula]
MMARACRGMIVGSGAQRGEQGRGRSVQGWCSRRARFRAAIGRREQARRGQGCRARCKARLGAGAGDPVWARPSKARRRFAVSKRGTKVGVRMQSKVRV